MNMEKFTEEQQKILLEMHGWKKVVGYTMDYEAPESANIIITLEEFRSKIGLEAEEYWGTDDMEILRDLGDAWECLFDDIMNQKDLTNEEETDAYLLNKINNKD